LQIEGIFEPASPARPEQGGVSAFKDVTRDAQSARLRMADAGPLLPRRDVAGARDLRPACAFLACDLAGARAGDGPGAQAATDLPQSAPAILYQLTDVGGLRSRLEKQGLSFIFSLYGDAFDNPFGGVKQGPGYDDRFAAIMDGDLQKLAGWSGQNFTPASTASSASNSVSPISTI
jgi:carbohydrate-selective porin OprB